MNSKERLDMIQFVSQLLRYLRDNGDIPPYNPLELPDICEYIVDNKLAFAPGEANVACLVIDGYHEFRRTHKEP